MIFSDISKTISQLGDPRFRRVLFLGLALTIGLLLIAAVGLAWLVGWLFPDAVTLPFLGEVTFLQDLASGFSVVAVLVLSVFLMVPVASAFTGLFLDDIADAVEDRFYPDLASAPRTPFWAGIADSLKFLVVIVFANILALALYAVFAPLAPFIFWGLNGFLLGREYFQLVALRRLSPPEVKRMRRRHAGEIWLAGALMAIPLTVPILNLIVPIVGVATFTHFYHRLPKPMDA